MRTLSLQEITLIDQRLESLKIYYLEIYHELKDHYFTELEKKSEEEFDSSFQQLNETFASSAVKRMEKSLEKSTERHISQTLWKQLHFWKLKNPDIYYFLLTMFTIFLFYAYWGVAGISLMVGIVSIIGIPITWYSIGREFNFKLKTLTVKSKKVVANQILDKSGVYYSGLFWIFISIWSWNNTHLGIIGTIIIWLIDTSLILYMVTLIRITLEWKKKGTYQISR